MLEIGVLVALSIIFFYISYEYNRYNKLKSLRMAFQDHRKEEDKTPVKIFVEFVVKYFGSLFPKALDEKHITNQLTWAGLNTVSFEVFTSIRILLFLVPLVIYPTMMGYNNQLSYILGVIFGVVLFMLPQHYLKTKIKARNEKIEKELFPLTELLLTSTQAGLDLNSGINRITRVQNQGIVSELFKQAFQMGSGIMTREESFNWIKQQTNLESLHVLIDAIQQSERLGTPISTILVQQLDRIRSEIRNKGLMQAQTINNKILIPTVMFVFIPLLIILIAPSILLALQL